MTTIEMIISGIGVLIALVAGAFGFGRSRGKSKAEQAATERETKAAIESQQAASQRQAETAKGASDVQDTVTRMSDRDVDDELLRDWTRKDSGS
ncbi:hypothetical protein A6J33_018090 [Pantoea sp. FDAARGOS_194]|uniref:hypothetical protein n=1 Tax=Pantoea TaxID=53335 RepID=UPI000BB590A3|nr:MULTISPECIES: hypothetical protein [Pantoea]PNK64556.1 hypothetical protein A6J33_018090 [Pantoea sp. FDAARGOS_194]